MPVNRDLSGLPRANDATREPGRAPDPVPRFGQLLAEHWRETHPDLEHAIEGSRFRHSDAGACSRAVAYASLKVPHSNPMDLAGVFIAEQGTLLHQAMQQVLVDRWGKQAEVEVKVGRDGWHSGHIDVVIRDQPIEVVVPGGPDTPHAKVISIEIKSVDGYAFKLAIGERGPAQGPKWQHILQAALNGREIDADEIVLLYLARGAVSIQAAQRKRIDELGRFMAEWTLTRDEYLPLAEVELTRIKGILDLVDEGTLPARKIPDPELPSRHEIVDPRKGAWVAKDTEGMAIDAGEAWQCVYCRWQDVCTLTPPGRVPLTPLMRATLGLREEETDGVVDQERLEAPRGLVAPGGSEGSGEAGEPPS